MNRVALELCPTQARARIAASSCGMRWAWADQVPTSCDLPRSIASLDALFSFLGEHIEAAAIDETTAYGLNLAAEELFTNMVRHNVGEGEFISVDLDISDERIRLLLTDHDVDPFDPSSVPAVDVTRPAKDRQPGGLGMHLVRSIVDRVSYEYENREMRVSVIKNRGH